MQKLNEVFDKLQPGMVVITNGDGKEGDSYFGFYSGVITSKTGDKIYIKRDDGCRSSANKEGWWEIINSPNNTVSIRIKEVTK